MFLFYTTIQAFITYFPVFFLLGGVMLGTFLSGTATLQTLDGAFGESAWLSLASSTPAVVGLAALEYVKTPFVNVVVNRSLITHDAQHATVSTAEKHEEVNFNSMAPTPVVTTPSVTSPHSSGQGFWKRAGGLDHQHLTASNGRTAAAKSSVVNYGSSE
jgi:hypothetical protein